MLPCYTLPLCCRIEQGGQQYPQIDPVIDATVKLINQPVNPKFDITKIIEQQRQFNGNLIVQSLLKGTYRGQTIDNTTEKKCRHG